MSPKIKNKGGIRAGYGDGTKGVYAPDTGPTAVRNEKNQIVTVTRLVCK